MDVEEDHCSKKIVKFTSVFNTGGPVAVDAVATELPAGRTLSGDTKQYNEAECDFAGRLKALTSTAAVCNMPSLGSQEMAQMQQMQQMMFRATIKKIDSELDR